MSIERQRRRTLEDVREMLGRGLPPTWQSRRDDPASSRISEALGRSFRPAQCARILLAVVQRQPCTVVTAAKVAGLSQYAASKRLSDLKRMGLVSPTGEMEKTTSGGVAELYTTDVEAEDREWMVGI